MSNEDVLIRATADFERSVVLTAVAINLAPFILDHRAPWAIGVLASSLAAFTAAYSQWLFRRCVPPSPERHAAFAASAYAYRRAAIALWFCSIAAFAAGAFQ